MSRLHFFLGASLTLIVCSLATERPLWNPGHLFGSAENIQIAEAEAILTGRLDLPERRWDTAFKDGKVYSYFPPLFTFIAAAVVPVFGGVPHLLIVGLAALIPLLAYVLFVRLSNSIVWGVLLAIGMVMGTSLWPIMDKMMRGATPYSVNHVLAVVGLLMLLISCLSRKHLILGGMGLVVAALSRQMTLAYALPLFFFPWRGHGDRRLRMPFVITLGACGVALGGTMTMNGLKFGNPLDSGYMHNYVDRDDAFALDARAHGLFSPHYVPRNLYYMNVGLPGLHKISIGEDHRWYLRPNEMGVGIWWTTPMLLWLFAGWKSIWSDPQRRHLLLATLLIIAALMFWHGTGSVQRGFNRYSLDFVPVLFALVVPDCLKNRRNRWLTVGCVVWSLLYFAIWLPRPNIRVW